MFLNSTIDHLKTNPASRLELRLRQPQIPLARNVRARFPDGHRLAGLCSTIF
jgi:hypothetical protein